MRLISDWDLDAAFLKYSQPSDCSKYSLICDYFRAHNTAVATNQEPCLCLRVDLKPFEEQIEDWQQKQKVSIIAQIRTPTSQEAKPSSRFHGMINQASVSIKTISFD